MTAVTARSSQHVVHKTTSLAMTQEMRQAMEAIATAVYGQRGQARWIEDALASFSQEPDFVLKVGAGEANTTLPVRKVIRLTPQAESCMLDMIKKVRRVDPLMDNVRSPVLRAALAHGIRKYQKQNAGNPLAVADAPDSAAQGAQISPTAPKLRRRG